MTGMITMRVVEALRDHHPETYERWIAFIVNIALEAAARQCDHYAARSEHPQNYADAAAAAIRHLNDETTT